jgi:membrane protein YqaA with SNARE-associated domain
VPTFGVFDVFYLVIIEASLWGFGTAIGELPPYFIAKAASMAGEKSEELEELQEQEGYFKTVSGWIEPIIKKHAFIVVLVCAAVPNPFFDLAGLMCGNFQIPFLTFFGATIIGKAIIKVSLQSFLTIIMFSHHIVESIITSISSVFPTAEEFMRSELSKQRSKLYEHDSGEETPSIVATIWSYVVLLMIAYFVYEFLNAIVQDRLKNDRKKNN